MAYFIGARILSNMGEPESEGGLDAADLQGTEWGGHPLFPRPETETGPDRRRFDIIQVQRYRADGTREICPKSWKGSELRSLEQIVDAYGGGTYQFTAQCGRTFRFQAFSDKVHLPGPSRPFVEMRLPPPEPTPEPAPVAAPPPAAPVAQPAPAPTQPAPPPGHVPGPAVAYPYPPHYPPLTAPSSNSDALAFARSLVEASSARESTLLRALVERPAAKETNPLEVVREIVPLLQGNAGGTQALLQGVELARGLLPGAPAQPVQQQPAQPDEDLALLGQVLRIIAPNQAPAPAAAPPPAAAAPPAATIAPPPGAPPPGFGWAFTAAGWVLVQVAHIQPHPLGPPAAPAPAAPAPAAPTASGVDLDAALGALLADPVRLARLRAALGAPPAPATAPDAEGSTAPSAGPVEAAQPKESAPQNAPAPAPQGLAAELEALTGDPALGPLFAALTAGGSA
ncbi:hypothetical protein [Polyangium jinanense]|uniref:Uncharacterized protein n=1 Tax=Polyangium jinanense TaxID=2829994 RepID=A0A9X4AXR4_9BACT|nr:hypothetical protein [Polyangium jinanense]MDC3988714.1 hypothetical protein [Polyangium jinanense]